MRRHKNYCAAEGVSTDSLKRCIVHRHRHDGQTHCAQASPTGMACLQRLRHCSAVAMAAARAAKRLWHGLACLDTLANLACRDILASPETPLSARSELKRCSDAAKTAVCSCVTIKQHILRPGAKRGDWQRARGCFKRYLPLFKIRRDAAEKKRPQPRGPAGPAATTAATAWVPSERD